MTNYTLDIRGRSRRDVLAMIGGLAATLGVSPAQAQVWPDKPGRIIVAFTPGTSTDGFARALAANFSAGGQSFIVENRPGAGGWTGTLLASQAKPDGTTLTFNANGMAILGLVQKNTFDATVDLTPIAIVARSPVALVVPSSIPPKTIKEFVDYAKSNEVFYGSAGVGSINHLYGELFNLRAGIKMKHLPYRGFGEALPDLAAGRIQMIFTSYATAAGLMKAGKLNLLAYGSDTRPEGTAPGPSVRESGIDYEASFWWGLFGPGGMAADLTGKINQASNEAMKEASFQKLFQTFGVVPAATTADAFKAEVKKHYTELKAVVDIAKVEFS